MKMKFTLLSALLLLFCISCSTHKPVLSANAVTAKVKTMAILPVLVQYTGNMPRNVTQAQLDSAAVKTGYTYQQILLANLQRYGRPKKKITVAQIQSPDKTNGLLNSAGISASAAFNADPDVLCKILGVDAVIKMNVTSNRIMSDLASMGIGAMRNLIFWGTSMDPVVGASVSNKTADVYANCVLVKGGETLWSASYQKPTNWHVSGTDVMFKITRKMGKRFPF
jgi:hypothetical protein